MASEALAAIERDEEHAFAYQWLMRWPLIGVGLASGDLDNATTHARALLRADQQAMPEVLEAALTRFLADPSAGTAESLQILAQEHGYL